jgi:hypothetical protein
MKRSPPKAARRTQKAAKVEPAEDVGAAKARTLAAATQGEALSGRGALLLFDAAAACAAGGCRRIRDVPNCLCRLAPALGANRDGGLWARTPPALAALGHDTSGTHREARARVVNATLANTHTHRPTTPLPAGVRQLRRRSRSSATRASHLLPHASLTRVACGCVRAAAGRVAARGVEQPGRDVLRQRRAAVPLLQRRLPRRRVRRGAGGAGARARAAPAAVRRLRASVCVSLCRCRAQTHTASRCTPAAARAAVRCCGAAARTLRNVTAGMRARASRASRIVGGSSRRRNAHSSALPRVRSRP